MFDSLGSWLAAIVYPLATRALVGLGFGYLTYTGVTTAIDGAMANAQAAMQGMPLAVFQLVGKFGFFDFMSITSGGLVSGLVWLQLKKLAVVGTGENGGGGGS